jgi:uncharacterized protein
MNMRTSPAAWRAAALTLLKTDELSATLLGGDTAQWVEAAASCGAAEAQLRLGHILLESESKRRDARAAFACFLCAAENGSADGHFMLARCLENGWGTEQNSNAAIDHARQAAILGHACAMNFLGRCHEKGLGAARDLALARSWYRRSARSGDFNGAYNYAMLIAAEGCIAGALHWFEHALSMAPQAARKEMVTALLSHGTPALRILATRTA